MKLDEIQSALREEKLDGWLFFDHHQRDPLAYSILGLNPLVKATRRWYYYVPAEGDPIRLVHRIEPHVLASLPGEARLYSRWSEQTTGLAGMLNGARRIAMQFSEQCAIPYISMVDGGTIDLVRSLGKEVQTSANLVQLFEARLTAEQLESHLEAGRRMDMIRRSAFDLIRERIVLDIAVSEWEIAEFLRERFRLNGLVTDHGPIAAVNGNASDPHYEPEADRHSPIRREDVVLIDMWAKLDQPDAVFYDITWTGFAGLHPPERVRHVFDVVRNARDLGVRTVQSRAASGLRGFEVDDAVRGYIGSNGFAEFFVHRTGHSIGTAVHGAGANMDNYETHDDRAILAGTCFSIEPGIYLPEFGIRSEVNVYVAHDGARVTGESQTELLILA